MTAKRTARPRRSAKTSARPPELTPEAIVTILEARTLGASVPTIDAELRRQLIAAEAYFLAERRGFAAGHEFDDWIAAEAAVDARLRESRVA
jgi:hypothetical protein